MSTVLVVDLNNFARYPTVSIGYITSVLRHAGIGVNVFAPLMVGVVGVVRERRPHAFSLLAAKLNYMAATSGCDWVRNARDRWAARGLSGIRKHGEKVVSGFRAELARTRPDVVLISTYLMYRDVCEEICSICHAKNIPVIIGGPYFVQREIISDWIQIDGLTALIAGEVEIELPQIVDAAIKRQDLTIHAGVITADVDGNFKGTIAKPLRELNSVPIPDYTDFPWSLYPNRIIPIITGRGCGWGACTFCSDVTSSAGRTFRSRSSKLVLEEVEAHHRRYDASRFVFTDLKLNSDVQMWNSIIAGVQAAAPGAKWIASVHVGIDLDNGLSDTALREAARNGCTRLSTGLESGSQRIIDEMRKGTKVSDVSEFLHNATSAGISSRCTMIVGYPSESAEDVHASAEFLAQHSRVIERVSLNRLALITGTSLHRMVSRRPEKFPDIHVTGQNDQLAMISYKREGPGSRAYRRAMMRLLTEVHQINARELTPRARDFEGVM